MNSEGHTFRNGKEEHLRREESVRSSPAPLEFDTPEQVLRRDREEVAVPTEVARRLEASLGQEPVRRVSWWRRWLGLGRGKGE
ncbi:MAG: hypothetical protein JNK85_07450 [Verrucomicrobiales bacterium]|nr:hypothetical protein [Verrucomicrobiales bacterium]